MEDELEKEGDDPSDPKKPLTNEQIEARKKKVKDLMEARKKEEEARKIKDSK